MIKDLQVAEVSAPRVIPRFHLSYEFQGRAGFSSGQDPHGGDSIGQSIKIHIYSERLEEAHKTRSQREELIRNDAQIEFRLKRNPSETFQLTLNDSYPDKQSLILTEQNATQ